MPREHAHDTAASSTRAASPQVGLGPTRQGEGRARTESKIEKLVNEAVESENEELKQEMIEMKMDLAEKAKPTPN